MMNFIGIFITALHSIGCWNFMKLVLEEQACKGLEVVGLIPSGVGGWAIRNGVKPLLADRAYSRCRGKKKGRFHVFQAMILKLCFPSPSFW